jgi:hypothetical protein
MATPRKRAAKVIKTVADESYSKLDQYCIWLNEYYRALKRAGFSEDMAFWLITNKDSYPDWVNGIKVRDIIEHIEDEEDE